MDLFTLHSANWTLQFQVERHLKRKHLVQPPHFIQTIFWLVIVGYMMWLAVFAALTSRFTFILLKSTEKTWLWNTCQPSMPEKFCTLPWGSNVLPEDVLWWLFQTPPALFLMAMLQLCTTPMWLLRCLPSFLCCNSSSIAHAVLTSLRAPLSSPLLTWQCPRSRCRTNPNLA